MNGSEGKIFGRERHLAHDTRYDRVDEFVEATLALWDSWDDDAVLLDRQAARFADSSKIRPVKYAGEWTKVDGPLNIPREPPGRPAIPQAGSSGRGRRRSSRYPSSRRLNSD
jgi:alkanesulfonate monooxygenase SsuD/methylene tetrahydromethanopterin reductase-like flavin-dependent oxidoreductase (luciferase family)